MDNAIYIVFSATPRGWGWDTSPWESTTGRALYSTARHFGRLAKRPLTGVA